MRINPYYLGFKDAGRISSGAGTTRPSEERERLGRQPGQGRAKMFEVREAENDQIVPAQLSDRRPGPRPGLYTYRLVDDEWQVADTDWRVVRDTLVARMDNFGLPYIVVEDGDYRHNRELYLRHRFDGDRAGHPLRREDAAVPLPDSGTAPSTWKP